MKHKRIEFTENQKALIFARDRGTCAFSGISLWFLDTGIRSNWQVDWVDHILPSASGGGAELENGICASNVFNAKKRDNTSDNIYFIKNGKLTEHYVRVFGVPPDILIEQLNRLKNLRPEDWFFNRSLSSLFVGFDCKCDKEFKGVEYKRDDLYWFKSAWKRLGQYQKNRGLKSITERGLIKNIPPFGSLELIKMESIDNEKDFLKWAESIYHIYRESYKALYNYFKITDNEERLLFIIKLEKIENLHPEIITALKAHSNFYNT